MSGFLEHLPGTWLEPDTAKVVTHSLLLARMAEKQVVLLGETHDRFDIHRWQLHVAAGLRAYRDDVAIGFEMFPRRTQPALDAWVEGTLSFDAFLDRSEWATVWRFDPALYAPLFHFCREARVPMLALNCERALVTRVGKNGWDAVPPDERDGLTPAKPASAAYRQYLLDITGGGGTGGAPVLADPARIDRFVRAQQVWDRAFACNIAAGMKRLAAAAGRSPLVIGIIGRGHLEYRGGTPFQLADLGIEDAAVLLPSDGPADREKSIGIGDALFRLPCSEGEIGGNG